MNSKGQKNVVELENLIIVNISILLVLLRFSGLK